MKKFIYFLAALTVLSATSCKDDDEGVFSPADDLERMPMTMFRKNHNTNVSESADPYGTRVVEGTRNSIQLHWYGVEGAAGYEIRYAVATGVTSGLEEDWSNPEKLSGHFTVGPDELSYRLDNLSYSTDYRFSIRVLHPDGKEEHHSKWYGMGNGQQWEDYMGVTTDSRYTTPNVIMTSDKDYDAFTVYIDLEYNPSIYTQAEQDTISARFQLDANNRFVAQTIILRPDAVNPDAKVPFSEYTLTPQDIDNGSIRITGLDPNSVYVVRIKNNNVPVDVDSYYNDVTMRTKGDPGAPILVKHSVATSVWHDPEATAPDPAMDQQWFEAEKKYQACLLDTLIEHYNSSPLLAEGQTYYLEGDKVYYTRNNVNINKGFILETLPEDVAAGKRAKVYLGGITGDKGSSKTNNFMFGKALGAGEVDAPVQVENVIFRNIDFASPLAHNFGDTGTTGSGNYFANMYSNGRGIEFESIQFENCTFQNFIRGFIRTQGSKVKVFKKLRVNNCLFYNMGYYKNNAGGYAWFCGELSSPKNNIFQDFIFTNNTIYDCPMSNFLTHGTNSGYDSWASDFHYKFTIENNTFINFCTRAANRFFDFRSFPGGSTVIFKRNLMVLAAADDDPRALENRGADIRSVGGDGTIILDFADNYSAGCRENHLKDNGIFSGQEFSSTKNNFGKYYEGNREDLFIKVGNNPLKATELFVNPNPRHKQVDGINHGEDHIGPANIYEDLKMRSDAKVTSHEIWLKNVGDPRWRQADPLHCYDNVTTE
ncbi:hypothetical protein [uncultured Duncaniella sp.]|uniref:hypothetical protein n=1 Tax=uncultured Duncaniella sp. TaxID=2768039 RepID=UPI00266FE8B4|nr:hypothetical protein [uncultured Duncaniella sp.]